MGQVVKTVPPQFDLARFAELGFASLRADPHARLQAALLVSFALHLFVVIGVSVRAPDRNLDVTHSPLIVDLVNSRTQAAPVKPDILAQANLDGGGNTDADRQAKTPLPMAKRQQTEPDAALNMRRAQPQPQEQREPKRVMTQPLEPAPAMAQPEAQPRVDAQSEIRPLPNASDLINSSKEELRLQARIARETEVYQKRPRRTFIGSRAREFRFARYIEDWRTKIERIGELNYPAAARGIYGSLQVSVAIRADGSLEGVEINRSSGHKVLDEAAIRIVRQAAPFAPFPPDIAKDTDILSITRTWSFTRADQFQAE
jgi:periplasmic protein TonB